MSSGPACGIPRGVFPVPREPIASGTTLSPLPFLEFEPPEPPRPAVDPSRPLWLVKAARLCDEKRAVLPEVRFEPLDSRIETTGRDQDRIRYTWHKTFLMRVLLSAPAMPVRLSTVI